MYFFFILVYLIFFSWNLTINSNIFFKIHEYPCEEIVKKLTLIFKDKKWKSFDNDLILYFHVGKINLILDGLY